MASEPPNCGITLGDTFYFSTGTCQIADAIILGKYLVLSNSTVPNETLEWPSLENKTIVAAAVDQPTFYYSVRFKDGENGVDEFDGGINVEAYRLLRDALNFQEKALKSRGSMKANEKGHLENQGIAQVLNSGKADIAISLFDPLPYRIAGPHGVRFLHAVFKSSKAVVVFTQPPKNSARNIYGLPFHASVWLALVALYALALLTLWPLMIAKMKGFRFAKANIWLFSVFTRQGFNDGLMSCWYLRIALMASFMASVIFHSVFSSNLTSILAEDYKPITEFSQVLQKFKIYYDTYVPAILDILEDFSNLTVVEMGRNVTKIVEAAAPEIFKSKSALITSEDRYYPFFKGFEDGFLCKKLAKLEVSAVSVKNANFLKQGSPYRDLFNVKFLLMLQSGLIERLYKEHDIKSRLTCLESFQDFLQLDVFDTGLPFLIVFYALITSVVILITERIVCKVMNVRWGIMRKMKNVFKLMF